MKKRTKILSVFLTVAILITSMVFVLPMTAQEGAEVSEAAVTPVSGVWTDHASSSFANGVRLGAKDYGTETKPYEISTAEEFAYLAWLVNRGSGANLAGMHFVLTSDIDLSRYNWEPIAKTYTNSSGFDYDGNGVKEVVQMSFAGVFDGGGHTISGLNYVINDDMFVNGTGQLSAQYGGLGLFGVLRGATVSNKLYTAKVRNFTLEGSVTVENMTSQCTNFGLAVGMVAVAAYANAEIENVNVNTTINISTGVGAPCIGGIIGYATAGAQIEGCTVSGEITVDNTVVGNTGTVKAYVPSAGGLVGRVGDGAHIEDCVNHADITVKTKNSFAMAGGIIARTQGNYSTAADKELEVGLQYITSLVNVANYGDVTIEYKTNNPQSGSEYACRAGGMIGQTGYSGKGDALLIACVNHGEIRVSHMGVASGVSAMIGLQEGIRAKLDNCYSTTLPVCDDAASAATYGFAEAFVVNPGGGRETNAQKYYRRASLVPAGCIFMEDMVVETLDGAALRINPTRAHVASVRFDFVIGEKFLEKIAGLDYTYGTIITTAEIADAAAANADNMSQLVQNIPTKEYRNSKTFDVSETEKYSVVTNLKEDSYNTELVAISYVTLIIDEENGYSITFYTDYTAGVDERSASVKSLATAYYNMRSDELSNDTPNEVDAAYEPELGAYSRFTNEQLAIFKLYMTGGEPVEVQ